MVKAKKAEITEESKHDDTYDIGGTLEAGPSDEPPIDESNYERIDEYADDIDIDARNDDADVDYRPDDTEESDADEIDLPPDDGTPRVSLSKAHIRRLRQSGSRLKYQLGYLNWGSRDHPDDFVLNNVVVTGMTFIAITDWMIANRELFFNSKPLETHGHRWLDCEDGIPPRPETFADKKEWENFPGTDRKMDPWSISYALPLTDESGSLILFQAKNVITKQAIGALVSEFDGRRPIIELSKTEKSPNSKSSRPVFKFVGFAKKIDNFDFLREMLIVNDEPYIKPKFESDF